MTLLYVTLSILPIVTVKSPLVFSLKICGVIAVTNVIGFALYRRQRRSAEASRSERGMEREGLTARSARP